MADLTQKQFLKNMINTQANQIRKDIRYRKKELKLTETYLKQIENLKESEIEIIMRDQKLQDAYNDILKINKLNKEEIDKKLKDYNNNAKKARKKARERGVDV